MNEWFVRTFNAGRRGRPAQDPPLPMTTETTAGTGGANNPDIDLLERRVGQLTADLAWTQKQLRSVKKTKHRLERERDEAKTRALKMREALQAVISELGREYPDRAFWVRPDIADLLMEKP